MNLPYYWQQVRVFLWSLMLLAWAASKLVVNSIMVLLCPTELRWSSLLNPLMALDPLPIAIESRNSVTVIEFHRSLPVPLIDALCGASKIKQMEKEKKSIDLIAKLAFENDGNHNLFIVCNLNSINYQVIESIT